jgi:hypothetical protein
LFLLSLVLLASIKRLLLELSLATVNHWAYDIRLELYVHDADMPNSHDQHQLQLSNGSALYAYGLIFLFLFFELEGNITHCGTHSPVYRRGNLGLQERFL